MGIAPGGAIGKWEGGGGGGEVVEGGGVGGREGLEVMFVVYPQTSYLPSSGSWRYGHDPFVLHEIQCRSIQGSGGVIRA